MGESHEVFYRIAQRAKSRDRHFLYGVNCYQYVIGERKPIVGFLPSKNGVLIISYPTIHPGQSSGASRETLAPAEFLKVIKSGLIEDKFKPAENSDDLNSKRHIALLFRERDNDFHFCVREENGLWSSKHPFGIKSFKHPREFAEDGYFPAGNFLFTEKTASTQIASIRTSGGFYISSESYDLADIDFSKPGRDKAIMMLPSDRKKDAMIYGSQFMLPAPGLDSFPPKGLTLGSNYKFSLARPTI